MRYLDIKMIWDAQQYGRFADERARPFLDLVSRIGAQEPRRVVDLGCGPGTLTALLAQRWPGAVVEGIDSSPEMIAAAAADGVSFRVEDVMSWAMPHDADVVISNATLQWVPSHRSLLTQWAATLPSGGWLAFQVPGNFGAPSHTVLRALASSPRWAAQLGAVLRHDAVAEPAEYASLLLAAGLDVDVWETTYLHVLAGADPVLQWMRGTALRPVIAALSAADYAGFEAELAAALREAYPTTPHGTLFPFRRIFAVAHRAGPR
jgi:trans-aconitate 2-methyltransferase